MKWGMSMRYEASIHAWQNCLCTPKAFKVGTVYTPQESKPNCALIYSIFL